MDEDSARNVCVRARAFAVESRPLMKRAFDGFIKLLWFRLVERQEGRVTGVFFCLRSGIVPCWFQAQSGKGKIRDRLAWCSLHVPEKPAVLISTRRHQPVLACDVLVSQSKSIKENESVCYYYNCQIHFVLTKMKK